MTCIYENQKPICDFLFVGYSNVFSIYQNVQDVDNTNVHDLDIQKRTRSHIYMRIESPYVTSYLLAITMLVLSIVHETFTHECTDVLVPNLGL